MNDRERAYRYRAYVLTMHVLLYGVAACPLDACFPRCVICTRPGIAPTANEERSPGDG